VVEVWLGGGLQLDSKTKENKTEWFEKVLQSERCPLPEVRTDPTRRQVDPQQTKQSLVSAVDDANRLNRASSFPIGSNSMQKKTVSPRKPTELQQATAEDQGDDKSGANSTDGVSNLR
jgi:hypothetical protein